MAEGRKRIPTRSEELQVAFMHGNLPEQNGVGPRTFWCPPCKGVGTVRADSNTKLRQRCEDCAGTGIRKAS